MSILSRVIFILLSSAFTLSSGRPQLEHDNMCQINGAILCIKGELVIIRTIAKNIARASIEIEQHIRQTLAVDRLDQYVNTEMNYTRFHRPTSFYHRQFFQLNNIDRQYLTELFAEAHHALIYYYNSIDDLLKLDDVFGKDTDQRFHNIQDNIRYEMICRYRNVLHVYSHQQTSFNHLYDRIQFSTIHRLSPSVVHDVHSIVIARYLRQWMEDINDVIVNLEMKFV